MGRAWTRWSRAAGYNGVWRLLCVALAACGGGQDAGGGDEPSRGTQPNGGPAAAPARSERVICPMCSLEAGGETSDFGDGSAYLPTGSGQYAVPTPCQRSEQPVRIDAAEARALGFGALLDRLETAFVLPFEWTPLELTAGEPAAGYTPRTWLHGSTQVTAIERRNPTLQGCEESLLVGVATVLETEDAALSIAGQLATQLRRDTFVPQVSGLLDLSTARGTLEIFPPITETALVAYVPVDLYLWPDAVRAGVSVFAIDPQDLGSDTPGYAYAPLQGRAPLDACDLGGRPVAASEPILSAGGALLSERYAEIQAWLDAAGPFPARWNTGASTTVSVGLGQAFDVCDTQGSVTFKLPFSVNSADGRVAIARDAVAYADWANGAWKNGSFEIYRRETEELAASFAAATGISGVEFGDLGGAIWRAALYMDAADARPRGEVTVEGVDIDGHVTGTEFAITGVLETLTW